MIKRCSTLDAKRLGADQAFSEAESAAPDGQPREASGLSAVNHRMPRNIESAACDRVSDCHVARASERNNVIFAPDPTAGGVTSGGDGELSIRALKQQSDQACAKRAAESHLNPRATLLSPEPQFSSLEILPRVHVSQWQRATFTVGSTHRCPTCTNALHSSISDVHQSPQRVAGTDTCDICATASLCNSPSRAAERHCRLAYDVSPRYDQEYRYGARSDAGGCFTIFVQRTPCQTTQCYVAVISPMTNFDSKVVLSVGRARIMDENPTLHWTAACSLAVQRDCVASIRACSSEYAASCHGEPLSTGQLELTAISTAQAEIYVTSVGILNWSASDVTSKCRAIPEALCQPILIMARGAPGANVLVITTNFLLAIADGITAELQLLVDTQAYLRARAARGRPSATLCTSFQEFYQQYAPLILTLVKKHRVPEHAVDDCVQEVWCTIVRTLGSFDPDPRRGTFRSWLNTVIYHEVVDFRRRMRVRWAKGIDAVKCPLCSRKLDPAEALENCRRACLVREMLERLRREGSELSYQVVSRRWFAGQEISEVASSLNLAPRDVYDRTYWALGKLRELLEHNEVQPTTSCSTGHAGKRRPQRI